MNKAPLLLKNKTALRKFIKSQKAAGKTIALVPTMGALHAGHASLIKKARQLADAVVRVSDLLKKSGNIIIKTDNTNLYEFTLEQIQETGFTLISKTEDYVFDETKDIQSEYERNFRSLGQNL